MVKKKQLGKQWKTKKGKQAAPVGKADADSSEADGADFGIEQFLTLKELYGVSKDADAGFQEVASGKMAPTGLIQRWADDLELIPDLVTKAEWYAQWGDLMYDDVARRCGLCKGRGTIPDKSTDKARLHCPFCRPAEASPQKPSSTSPATKKEQKKKYSQAKDLVLGAPSSIGKEGMFEGMDKGGKWWPIIIRSVVRTHVYWVEVCDGTSTNRTWPELDSKHIRLSPEWKATWDGVPPETSSPPPEEADSVDAEPHTWESVRQNIRVLVSLLPGRVERAARDKVRQEEGFGRGLISMLRDEEKIGSFLVGMRVVAVRDVVVEGRTVAKKGDTGTVQRPQEQSGGRVPVAFDHKRKPTVQVAPRCLKPKREVDIETAAAEAAAKEAAAAAPAAVAAEQAPAPDPDVRLAEKKKAKEQPTPKKKEEQPTPKKKEEQPTPKKKEEQKAEPSAAESPQQVAKGKRKGEVKEKDKAAAASKEAPAASEKASAKKKEAPAAQEGVGGKKQEKVAAPEGPGRKRKEVPAAQEAATGKQVSTPAAQPHPKPASKDVPIPVADGWVQAQQKQQRVAQRKAEQDAPTTPAAPAPRQFAPSESSGASVSPRPARPGGSRHASGSQQGPAGTPSDRGRHHRDPAGSSSPLPTATRSAAAPLAQPQRLRPAEEPGEGRSTGSCSPPPAAAAVLAAGPVAQPQHLPPAEEPGVPRARYTRPLEDLILRCGGGTARRSPAELEREVRTLERVGRALDMLEEKWRRPFLHSMRGFKEFCERTATERERAAADHRAAAARLRDTMQRITSYGRVPPSCQCGQVVPLEPRAELSVTLQDGGELLFTARLSRELGVEHVAPGGRRSSREPRLAGRVKWDPTAEVLTVNGKTYHPELPEWYGSRGPLLAAMSGQCGVAEGFPEQWAACPMCDSGGLRRGAEDAQRSYRAEEQRKAAFGVPFPTAREIAVDRAVWRRRLTMLQPPRVPLQPADRCDPPAD
eukprot:TRINITY_DN3596_c0_g1_i1.p1 TRINITY_DN3596_c0_g1~~TRINITY_DN3596_c0_g1_i1.p1  ORF type:complete len:979 (+),score=205.13 TRINITY_DN3596_c0_g1_i1:146-3082(+)